MSTWLLAVRITYIHYIASIEKKLCSLRERIKEKQKEGISTSLGLISWLVGWLVGLRITAED